MLQNIRRIKSLIRSTAWLDAT